MSASGGRLSDQIKASISLSQAVETIVGVPLKRAGREQVGLCPFHDEKTPSFSVNDEKGVFFCRGCGAHGDVISLVAKHKGFEDSDSIFWLAEYLNLERKRSNRTTPENRKPQSVSTANREAAKHRERQGFALMGLARDYFVSQRDTIEFHEFVSNRGVSVKAATLYHIGFSPDVTDEQWWELVKDCEGHYEGVALPTTEGGLKRLLEDVGLMVYRKGARHSFFKNRIIFPIHDVSGRVCGFAGRAIHSGDRPKYLNSRETEWFDKSSVLYGAFPGNGLSDKEQQLWRELRQTPRVYVVEGYTDVLRLAECGVWGVAPMGTATSVTQFQWLARQNLPLVFMFDGDAAGQGAAEKAVRRFWPLWTDGLSASLAFVPDGEDPDEWLAVEGNELDAIERQDYVDAVLALPEWASAFAVRGSAKVGASEQIRAWRLFLAFIGENEQESAELMRGVLRERALEGLPAIPVESGARATTVTPSALWLLPGVNWLLGCIRAHPEKSKELIELRDRGSLDWAMSVPEYSALVCILAAAHCPYEDNDGDWLGWSVRLHKEMGVPASIIHRWRECQGAYGPDEEGSWSEVVGGISLLINHLRLGLVWAYP